ncbi:flagellar hook-length control protein FliK [Bacterioplanoides sp.]|uniref:flagellar hook-length control protein FliK n=1 Tax=Bacterioplanoides sp. TaxID=2066072 RepID=UPI003B00E140
MNPTEVSQGGLFSLLPSVSTLQTAEDGQLLAEGSDFSSLLEGLSLTPEDALLPERDGAAVTQLLPLDGQPLPQLDGEPIQPSVLLASIRQSQGLTSSGLQVEVLEDETLTDENGESLATVLPTSLVAQSTNTPANDLLRQPASQDPASLKATTAMPSTQDADVALEDLAGEELLDDGALTEEEALAEAKAERPGVTQIRSEQSQVQTRTTATAEVMDNKAANLADITPLSNTVAADAGKAEEVIVTEAEAEQLEEQEQVTQSKERLEFGRDKEKWAPALGSRIVTMVADNIQQAEIHLDPPELGSMEIKMQVNQEQTSIQVQVQSTQVRDVLEANAQRLRDALAEQGMELAGFDVSQQQSDQQSAQQQAAQQQAESGPEGHQGGDNLVAAEGDEATTVTVRESDGLLDAYA